VSVAQVTGTCKYWQRHWSSAAAAPRSICVHVRH